MIWSWHIIVPRCWVTSDSPHLCDPNSVIGNSSPRPGLTLAPCQWWLSVIVIIYQNRSPGNYLCLLISIHWKLESPAETSLLGSSPGECSVSRWWENWLCDFQTIFSFSKTWSECQVEWVTAAIIRPNVVTMLAADCRQFPRPDWTPTLNVFIKFSGNRNTGYVSHTCTAPVFRPM